MPTLQLQRYEQLKTRMIQRVVARAGLTDLNDSSVLTHILGAAAREIDDANYQLTRLQDTFSIDRASGDDLDERALEIQPGTLSRDQAQRGVGFLVFSRSSNTGSTITIPIGTVVKTADGVSVRTTKVGTITNTSSEQIAGHGVGRDSDIVAAMAVQAGASGNIAVNTAIKFASKPAGVTAVTNTSAFVQGRDQESDDEFRARLKLFVASLARGTPDALKFAALGLVDSASGRRVVFAHVFADPSLLGNVSLYVDDGAGTAETFTAVIGENVTAGLLGPPADTAVGGEEFLRLDHWPVRLASSLTVSSSTRGALTLGTAYVINPASGLIRFLTPLVAAEQITATYSYFTGLIAVVQRVIDGDPTDRLNFPGVAAAGVIVQVLAPVTVPQTVQATIFYEDSVDQATVQAAIETAVTDYINNLGISGDVIRNEVIERIMAVDGVNDINLTIPAANVTILDSQIARITTTDIDLF